MSSIVCLTFDIDSVALWTDTFRSSSPSAISRGEYDFEVGVPRVLDLLEKHSVQGTFFIPGKIAELFPEGLRQVKDRGHEIASHGDGHGRLVGLGADEERKSLSRGIERLVDVTGITPTGFRAPAWELSFETIEILEEFGIRYDSSLFAHDFTPHKARRGDRLENGGWQRGTPSSIWEFPIAWELDDVPYFLMQPPGFSGGIEPRTVGRIWAEELDYMIEDQPDGVFTLTMHPQVIGRGPRIKMLDQFIQHAKSLSCDFSTLDQATQRLEQS